MKRILKMILTGVLLFCTVFSIVGCGEEENSICGEPIQNPELGEGPLYRVKEVYEAGEIDRTALLNIAYYSESMECNPPKVEEEVFELLPKGELGEEISLEIKEYIAEQFRTRENNQKPEAKGEDFIIYYYGCYNGYYVFRHNDPYYVPIPGFEDTTDIKGIWIDGIFLVEEYPQYIYAWKEI